MEAVLWILLLLKGKDSKKVLSKWILYVVHSGFYAKKIAVEDDGDSIIDAPVAGRVVGGDMASQNEFPFLVW